MVSPVPHRARGVSRSPWTGGGMWWTGRCREASGIGADGEIVWSWRAQARRSRRCAAPEAAWRRRWQFSTVHRGEHAISRNPLRKEGRSVSAVPVVNARSRNFLCAGAPGACGHPAFPVPSRFEGDEDARLGRKASRECKPAASILSWPILRDAVSRLLRMRS
jgi:hypothetical protein